MKVKNQMQLLVVLLIATVLTGFNVSTNEPSEEFNIFINRESIDGKLITGSIYLNGAYIGKTYENADYIIPAGNYDGVMRYSSTRGFVQSQYGVMGNKGDFLLEVSDVTGRTDILFHAGNKPKHSKGCVLLGAITRGYNDVVYVDEHHPLRLLRLAFYGTDEPLICPDIHINISITDNF